MNATMLALALLFAAPEDDAMRDLSEDLAKEAEAAAENEETTMPVVLPEGSGNDCFNLNSVSDFEILDRENLIVFAPNKRTPYWVQIFGFCREIRYANSIGFESRDNRICSYGGDSIIAGDEECSIRSIHRLDETSYYALKQQIATKRAARGRKR